MVAISAVVGIGVVVASQRGGGPETSGLAEDLAAAGRQAEAARAFCTARPDLCANVAAGVGDLARQEAVRRLAGSAEATPETTGKIVGPPARSALPANPPLPPRRPAAFP